MKKRVFVTDYVGLSTRLEALAMAFLISDYYGHEVCLDWQEFDALRIIGAHKRGRGLLGRINSIKLRGDAFDGFNRIGDYANVNLRTHHGPQHLLRRMYLPTAQRVKLRPHLIDIIRDTFAKYENRPLVGVHIRRGDFPLIAPDVFDVNAFVWPAVPDWWYEHVMAKIQEAVPNVAFFISCSGSLDDFPQLKNNFDVFDMPAAFTYTHLSAGHASARHPAADLFALGCCNTMIGSSCSTFTHYAANMLGYPTQVLIPPAVKMSQAQPSFVSVDLYGRGAADWYGACRTGAGTVPVADASLLRISNGARVDWM
jgi:hypothetical protein